MTLHTLLRKLSHARLRLTCKLPMVQAQDLLNGRENLGVQVPFISNHWETASLFDHLFIGSLARIMQPELCLEIGTSLGLVTSTLAANTPAATVIHTVDVSDDPRIGSFFRGKDGARKIRQHFGPSAHFDFSSLTGSLDLIFIDGSHRRDDVLVDSWNAFHALSERGVILWHDVSPHFPGVIRALESLRRDYPIVRIHGTSFGMYSSPGSHISLALTGKGNRDDRLARSSLHPA